MANGRGIGGAACVGNGLDRRRRAPHRQRPPAWAADQTRRRPRRPSTGEAGRERRLCKQQGPGGQDRVCNAVGGVRRQRRCERPYVFGVGCGGAEARLQRDCTLQARVAAATSIAANRHRRHRRHLLPRSPPPPHLASTKCPPPPAARQRPSARRR